MTAFNLPDLGEGLREAEIVTWHVGEGDHVVVDQPLLSVETDKAVVEIPSPKSGRVAHVLARVGDRVAVGSPLLTFEEGAHADTGTVVGKLIDAIPAPVSQRAPAAVLPRTQAAPAVRARARELGVELSRIKPSGVDGTITLADVETAAQPAASGQEALRGVRRIMALNMIRAGREVVLATLLDEADVEIWIDGEDITIRLIRAIAAACKAEPILNASLDSATLSVRSNIDIDLGLAIDSKDGLFVPVLRNVGRSAPESWRQQVEAAKIGVKERSLSPRQLRDPTITLSNFGRLGGQHAALVIIPPQVAILGAGRIRYGAVRNGTAVVMHRKLPLSLTFDHRAVTGGEATRFLRTVIIDLEKPR